MKLKLSKIGTRLALLVGVIGVTLAILQSAFMAYFELQIDRDRMQKATQKMLASSSTAAARAVFELNKKAAQELLNGLMVFDYVVLGRIDDELGNTLAEFEKKNSSLVNRGTGRLLRVENETFNLSLVNPNTKEPGFGTLSVKISAITLLKPLIKRVVLVFSMGVLNAVLLILILWLIVHFFITVPLINLERGVKAIGEGHWGKLISINRKDELGDLAITVNSMADQLKRTFDNLSTSEMKYRELVENINDVIYTVDKTGLVTYISPAIESISGYQPQEVIGKPFSHFIYKEDLQETLMLFQEVFSGATQPHECRIIRKSGETCWIRISNRLISKDGHTMGLQGVMVDIDLQKRLEAQLQQSQKMESIGTLAGGIAHDFNNILSPIITHSEIAMMVLPSDNPLQHNLKEIFKAGGRAKELVKQILTFSRKEEGERVIIKIIPILKETIKMLRSSIPSSVDIRQNFEAEVDTVLADPTQIHQIMLNLGTNAAYAMREKGGTLSVSLVPEDIDSGASIRDSDLKPGPYLKLTVSDTGSGIDNKTLKRIFEPYFTTKGPGEGTGMGLALIHGIVKSHGGAITVESELGEGTTFNIYLPKIETDLPTVEIPAVKLPGGTEKILFVDDEKIVVDAIQPVLEHLGYNVTVKTNSVEALEVFRDNPKGFDIVITDMTMPNMSGKDLAEELMSIQSDIPIILCTGFSEQIDEKKAKDLGISAFIMKPIVMHDIANTIREVLDKK